MALKAFKKLREELRRVAAGLEGEQATDLNNLVDAYNDTLSAKVVPIETARPAPEPLTAWDVEGHDNVIAFQAAPVTSEDDPPKEFKILNFGTTRMRKGGRIFNIIFDEVSRDSVFAALESQGRKQLPIDFDHGMLGFISTRESSMAAGWFTLEARSDGLWAADIEWTKKAFESIKEREFRFTSPALFLEELEQVGDFRATEVINVALTNLPATVSQKPLVANSNPGEETEMKFTKEMLEKLGLKEDASDEQIAERLSVLASAETIADNAKKEAERATVLAAKAVGVAQEKKEELAAAKADQQKLLDSSGASDLDQIATRLDKLGKVQEVATELSTRVATLEADQQQSAWQMAFNTLDTDGKMPESLHDWAKTQSAEQLSAWGKGAPVVLSAARHTPPAGGGPGATTVTLTSEDQKMATLMGLDVAKFAAVRATEGQPLKYQSNIVPLSRVERNKPAGHYIQPYMTGTG